MNEEKETIDTRVSRLEGYLTRAYKHNKPSILFALYLSEFQRADIEKTLEKLLKEQRLEIVDVDAGKYKNLPDHLASINSKNTVFFVHYVEKGFPDSLQYLNFKRETIAENHIKVVFWVTEKELISISREAPDFFAFRNRVVEFMEVPLKEEGRPAVVEFALETEYKSLDEIKSSIKLKEKLLAELSDDDEMSGYLLGSLGVLYYRIGSFKKSIEYCEKALKVVRNIGDKETEGVQLGNLGNAYRYLGNVKKAADFYEKALIIAREIGDRRNEGAWLGNLGIIYRDFGKGEKAIEYIEKALKIAEEMKLRDEEANSVVSLGSAYYALGNIEKAIEEYEKALEISYEIGSKRGESSSFGSLGLAYSSLGDKGKAIEYYEKALKIVQEIGDKGNEWVWLANIGLAYHDKGEIKNAMRYYKKALKIAQEIGDRHGEGSCLNSLGVAFEYEKKHKEALACFLQAKDRHYHIKDKHLENILSNLKKIKKELGYKEFKKLQSNVAHRAAEIVKIILEETSA